MVYIKFLAIFFYINFGLQTCIFKSILQINPFIFENTQPKFMGCVLKNILCMRFLMSKTYQIYIIKGCNNDQILQV